MRIVGRFSFFFSPPGGAGQERIRVTILSIVDDVNLTRTQFVSMHVPFILFTKLFADLRVYPFIGNRKNIFQSICRVEQNKNGGREANCRFVGLRARIRRMQCPSLADGFVSQSHISDASKVEVEQ